MTMQTAAIPATLPQVIPTAKIVHIIPAKTEFTEQGKVKKTLRAAAYCRVSTDKDEQEKSYDAQVSYFTDRIMENEGRRTGRTRRANERGSGRRYDHAIKRSESYE